MGQYHLPVNYRKKEFLSPHTLGVGFKQWEQIASMASVPQALYALLCTSNHRGGGDLDGEEYYTKNGVNAAGVLGRWAGDPIAIIGDYSEDYDLPRRPYNEALWHYCCEIRARQDPEYTPDDEDPEDIAEFQTGRKRFGKWTDITELVIPVLEKNLGVIIYTEPGHTWRSCKRDPKASFSIL
jgi:hypothetical protein